MKCPVTVRVNGQNLRCTVTKSHGLDEEHLFLPPERREPSLSERAVAEVICPRCKAKPGEKCFTLWRPETWRAPIKSATWRPHKERTRALNRVVIREAARDQGVTQKELRRRVKVENARLPYDTDMRLARQARQAWDRDEQAALTSWLLQYGDVLWEVPGETSAGEEVPLSQDGVVDVPQG